LFQNEVKIYKKKHEQHKLNFLLSYILTLPRDSKVRARMSGFWRQSLCLIWEICRFSLKTWNSENDTFKVNWIISMSATVFSTISTVHQTVLMQSFIFQVCLRVVNKKKKRKTENIHPSNDDLYSQRLPYFCIKQLERQVRV
jgi:hypothetical protein